MDNKELELAGIDVENFMARIMNNTSLIPMFVSKFLADTNMEQLEKAIAENKMEDAEKATHTLKGMAGNFAINELYELFNQQLLLFRAGEYEKGIAMMGQIRPAFENTVQHLRIWMSQQ